MDAMAPRRGVLGGWHLRMVALVIREGQQRFSRRGGLFGTLLEPIGIVVATCGVHYLIGGVRPPYGQSILVYYATGILYHFTFQWISMQGKEANMKNLPFPIVHDVDLVLASVVVQAVTMLIVMCIVFGTLGAWGIEEAIPHDPARAVFSWLIASLFGLAVALINSVITPMFHMWRFVYQLFVRLTLMLSGVFFIPDFLPYYRDWLAWVPMLHGVTLFRGAFIEGYPHVLLDVPYFLLFTLCSLVLGFALERVTRRRRAAR
jgi:capsular polysaccharide transport system permease protein